MKVVITKEEVIPAKSGVKYHVFKGISEGGSTVELWFPESDSEAVGICAAAIADPASVQALFDAESPVSVEFNQRGRVDSVKPA